MKKLIILFAILSLFIIPPALAKTIRVKTVAQLQGINGASLADGDAAFLITLQDDATYPQMVYFCIIDADSAAAQSVPDVISPTTNAGDKRWLCTASGGFETNDITWGDGTETSITWTWDLSAGDPDVQFANGSFVFDDESFTLGSGNFSLVIGNLSMPAGNIILGNGTPDVTQNGADAYITGTLEVDADTRLDGNLSLGTTQWNSGDDIDGEQIADDTIDDDSIDFADVTCADITTTDCGAVTLPTADVTITAGDLTVGNGTPDVTQDGEDAYIEGTLEVDGQATLDGRAYGDWRKNVNYTQLSNFETEAHGWTLTNVDADLDLVVDGDMESNWTGCGGAPPNESCPSAVDEERDTRMTMRQSTDAYAGSYAIQVVTHGDGVENTSGTATADTGDSSTMIHTGAGWGVNTHADDFVTLIFGTGSGQTREIASNTADTLTLKSAWTTNPDATSLYTIRETAQNYGDAGFEYRDTPIVENEAYCVSARIKSDGTSQITARFRHNSSEYFYLNRSSDINASDVFSDQWQEYKRCFVGTATVGGATDFQITSTDETTSQVFWIDDVKVSHGTIGGAVDQPGSEKGDAATIHNAPEGKYALWFSSDADAITTISKSISSTDFTGKFIKQSVLMIDPATDLANFNLILTDGDGDSANYSLYAQMLFETDQEMWHEIILNPSDHSTETGTFNLADVVTMTYQLIGQAGQVTRGAIDNIGYYDAYPHRYHSITFDDGTMTDLLYTQPILDRHDMIGMYNVVHQNAVSTTATYMNEGMIETLYDKGACIGSHGATHSRPITNSLTAASWRWELLRNQRWLDWNGWRRCSKFHTYAWGETTPEFQEQVARIFDMSFPVMEEINSFPIVDPYRIYRKQFGNSNCSTAEITSVKTSIDEWAESNSGWFISYGHGFFDPQLFSVTGDDTDAIDAAAVGTAITGTGTDFDNDVAVDEIIGNWTVGWRYVTAVSGTSITVEYPFDADFSGEELFVDQELGTSCTTTYLDEYLDYLEYKVPDMKHRGVNEVIDMISTGGLFTEQKRSANLQNMPLVTDTDYYQLSPAEWTSPYQLYPYDAGILVTKENWSWLLPSCDGHSSGLDFTVQVSGAFTATVTPDGAETIDGSGGANTDCDADGEAMTLHCMGDGDWTITENTCQNVLDVDVSGSLVTITGDLTVTGSTNINSAFYSATTGGDAGETTVAVGTYGVTVLSLTEDVDSTTEFTTAANEVCYTGTATKVMHVSMPISFERTTGAATDVITFKWGTDTTGAIGDGDVVGDPFSRSVSTSSVIGMGTVSAVISFPTNACVSLMSSVDDDTGGAGWTIQGGNLTIIDH